MQNLVSLREVQASDLPIFFEHQSDPEACRMAAFPSRERAAFYTHWEKILENDQLDKQTILYDGQVAGNVVCYEAHGKREVGYWIGREFWGLGIATRALQLFLQVLPFRPLYATVVQHNLGSQRVLEKCGFRLVEKEVHPGGPGETALVELIYRLQSNEEPPAR